MGIENTREWLTHYQQLEFEYDSWLQRLSQYKNAQFFPAFHIGDGSKKNPSSFDRMGAATIRRMDFESETSEEITAIKAEMKAIETAIKSLPNPLHRGVMIQRYIVGHEGYKPKPWKFIAFQLYHDDDDAAIKRVQRLHREALESLTDITDKDGADRQL